MKPLARPQDSGLVFMIVYWCVWSATHIWDEFSEVFCVLKGPVVGGWYKVLDKLVTGGTGGAALKKNACWPGEPCAVYCSNCFLCVWTTWYYFFHNYYIFVYYRIKRHFQIYYTLIYTQSPKEFNIYALWYSREWWRRLTGREEIVE